MSRIYLTVGTGSERLPADIALALIPSLPRAQLEQLVQRLVDRMDDEDGDPDLENALDTEDDELTDFARGAGNDGPGCILSDSHGVDDEDGVNMPEAYARERAAHPGAGCLLSDGDLAVDDGPCDDQFEDMEREVPFIPIYGENQSAGSIGWKL